MKRPPIRFFDTDRMMIEYYEEQHRPDLVAKIAESLADDERYVVSLTMFYDPTDELWKGCIFHYPDPRREGE